MITVAVGILSVFFVVGSITPLLLSDDTDGVVERRRYAADDAADDAAPSRLAGLVHLPCLALRIAAAYRPTMRAPAAPARHGPA